MNFFNTTIISLSILIISTPVDGVFIGSRTPSQSSKTGKLTYIFFKEAKDTLDDAGRKTKGKKTIDEDVIISYKKEAEKFIKIRSDLITTVKEKGLSTKIEPYKHLSYTAQNQIFQELHTLAETIITGLEKGITTYGKEKAAQAKELIKLQESLKENQQKLSNLTSEAQTKLENLKKVLTFSSISSIHKEVKKWGELDKMELPENNFLSTLTKERLGEMKESRKTTLEALLKKLNTLLKNEKDTKEQIRIQDLIDTITQEVASSVS